MARAGSGAGRHHPTLLPGLPTDRPLPNPNPINSNIMSIPTNIDGILIKRLRPAIDSALTEIGERFGVVLEAGNASYARDGKSGHFKLEVTAVDESGEAVNLEAEAFKKYAHMYGLKPEDLGSEITLRGTKYTIAGFRPKARKNNVSVTDKNGKVFVVPAVRISSALKQGVRP